MTPCCNSDVLCRISRGSISSVFLITIHPIWYLPWKKKKNYSLRRGKIKNNWFIFYYNRCAFLPRILPFDASMYLYWCVARQANFVSSSISSWQILTAHAQPFRGARDLAFCLKVPLDSLLVWASSRGSGETARLRRLAWTFAARIGDKYQIRLTRPGVIPGTGRGGNPCKQRYNRYLLRSSR